MKNKVIISLVFVLPLLIYFVLLAFDKTTTLEQSVIARENTPRVIVFSTPMCGECKRMSPIVEEIKNKYSDKVDIIKINAAENTNETNKLVREHNVYAVPTIVFFDKDGNVTGKKEGAMPYIEFEGYIKDILTD